MSENTAPKAEPLRVLIADDSESFRTDLKSFLETQENIDVVGEAGNGMRAINLAQTLKPDLILMDIAMPGVAGPEAVRVIQKVSPESGIVFVTIHDGAIFKDIAKAMNLDGLVPKQFLKKHLPRVLAKFKKIKGCT